MTEECVKIEVNGVIDWIPTTKISVVNPEQYIPQYAEVEEYVTNRMATEGITWHSVIKHNGKWVRS